MGEMIDNPGRPSLTVVMISRDDYEPCRTTVEFLERQTVLDQIELIIVAPSRQTLRLEEGDVEAFSWVQVVEFGEVDSTGAAFAAGARAARADWVIFGEEHSYPEPEWAEALIEAQQGPWAVVGCAMANANPDTITSWAHLFGQFGPVVVPVEPGVASYLAGHHSAYRRDLLLPFGDELPRLFESEIALHHALKAQGYEFFLAADAVSSHVNLSRLWPYIKIDYLGQRGFGATRWRALGWDWPRRLAYAAACPLVPFLRLARFSRDAWRGGRGRGILPWVFPIMGLAMIAGAAGEAMGYLFGARGIAERRIDLELDRYAYTVDSDRAARPRASSADSV